MGWKFAIENKDGPTCLILSRQKCKFQNSHKISNQGVWIPSHPKLSNSHINYISSIINEFEPGKFL